jgi:hypothetical protein
MALASSRAKRSIFLRFTGDDMARDFSAAHIARRMPRRSRAGSKGKRRGKGPTRMHGGVAGAWVERKARDYGVRRAVRRTSAARREPKIFHPFSGTVVARCLRFCKYIPIATTALPAPPPVLDEAAPPKRSASVMPFAQPSSTTNLSNHRIREYMSAPTSMLPAKYAAAPNTSGPMVSRIPEESVRVRSRRRGRSANSGARRTTSIPSGNAPSRARPVTPTTSHPSATSSRRKTWSRWRRLCRESATEGQRERHRHGKAHRRRHRPQRGTPGLSRFSSTSSGAPTMRPSPTP